eukprot:GHVN01043621.1.p1 GENE.GHVN01043621.1~~GHVN01043621.1.p1  ORF type:complete len:113 (-),score=10.44 GHVN01043621.1:202-540(-)
MMEEEMPDACTWNEKAAQYWSEQASTDDGVLQGYEALSPVDLEESNSLLENIKKDCPKQKWLRVLDAGAGIGRVVKGCLMTFFDEVIYNKHARQHLNLNFPDRLARSRRKLY